MNKIFSLVGKLFRLRKFYLERRWESVLFSGGDSHENRGNPPASLSFFSVSDTGLSLHFGSYERVFVSFAMNLWLIDAISPHSYVKF